jgi:hypothetical protein
MITPQEFITIWSNEQLVRYEPAIVKTLLVSDEAKHFLTELGLPKRFKGDIFDLPPNSLPSLPEALPHYHLSQEYQRYRLLGVEAFVDLSGKTIPMYFICLDNHEGGRIFKINNIEGLPAVFLNSSIEQLAEYLLILRQHQEWVEKNNPPYKKSSQTDAEYMHQLREWVTEHAPSILEVVSMDSDESWTLAFFENVIG